MLSIIPTIIFTTIFSTYGNNYKASVESALSYGNFIDTNSQNLNSINFNTWNLFTQLNSILIKIGFNLSAITYLNTFIALLIGIKSLSLVFNHFFKNQFLSDMSSILLILYSPHFKLGEINYPEVKFYGSNNYAIIGFYLLILSLGLLLNTRVKYALAAGILLISIHPTFGVISLLFTCVYSLKLNLFKAQNLRKVTKLSYELLSIVISSIIVFSSLVWHYSLKKVNFEISEFNSNIYYDYVTYWDFHRSPNLKFQWLELTVLNLIIILLILLLWKIGSKFNIKLFIIFIIFNQLILLSYIYFYFRNDFDNLFSRFQLIRFALLPSFFIDILLIIFIFKFIIRQKIKINKNNIVRILALFVIFTALIIKSLNLQNKNTNLLLNDILCPRSSELSITTMKTYHYAYYNCRIPQILNPGAIDFVPYRPDTVGYLKEIIEIGYQTNFTNIPMKYRNQASISDDLYLEKWTNLEVKDWNVVKSRLGIKWVIVPDSTQLKLNKVFQNSYFAVYEIQ